MNLQLVSVKTPAEWRDYHELRRIVLFESRGRFGVYDENHPDEHALGNYPMLLFQDDIPVGTIRIDLLPSQQTAYFRRVAIQENLQRQGLGRALMEQAETFAVLHGYTFFVANVAPDAIRFYEKLGYQIDPMPPTNLENPRMVKQNKVS